MPAHYGNKYAIGNTGGRPPFFETAQELNSKIAEYFDLCIPEIDKDSSDIISLNQPTITGLALHLGFASKQSLKDYENRNDEFSYLIKRARTVIEHFHETRMPLQSPTGSIFVLKNMDWNDKTQSEISGPNGGPIKTESKVVIYIPDNGRDKTTTG